MMVDNEKSPSDGATASQPDLRVSPDLDATSSEDLERLREDLNEATRRALRAQADLDNYRKRAQREAEEERRFANLPLLRDLLPVLDNVSRAVDAAGKAQEVEALVTGFKMVGKQLEDVLARYSVTKIEALQQPFDPHLHQAISQQPSADFPPSTVLLVAQDGYRLHDRVIRPSQVIVSVAP